MNLKSSKHGLNNSFFKLDNHPGNVNCWYIANCVWSWLEFVFIQTFLVSIWLHILRFSFILRIRFFTFPSIRPFVTFSQDRQIAYFHFFCVKLGLNKLFKVTMPFFEENSSKWGKFCILVQNFLELFCKSFHQIFMEYSWRHSWKEC